MDQPSEDSNKEMVEKSEVSSSSDDFNICSPCQPDLGWSNSRGNNPYLNLSKNNFSLRTSVLGSSLQPPNSTSSCTSGPDSQSNKTFILNPPKLSTPFTKPPDEEKEVESSNSKEKVDEKTPSAPKVSVAKSEGSSSSKLSFVPLGWNSSTPSGVSSSSSVGGQVSSSQAFGSFVFGLNLRDKVEGSKVNDSQTGVSSSDAHKHENNVEEPKSNGTTSEMLFSSAVKNESGEFKSADSRMFLSEAAREYEQARSVKRKFEPVQLITGEEHEQNVLQKFNYIQLSI